MNEENSGLEPREKRARTEEETANTQPESTLAVQKTIHDLSHDLLRMVFLNPEPSDLKSISQTSSSFRRAIDLSNITFWRAYSARQSKTLIDPKKPTAGELWLLGRRLDANFLDDIDLGSLWAFLSKNPKTFVNALVHPRLSKNQPLLDKLFRYIFAQYAVKSIPAARQSLNYTILFWAIVCNQPEQVRELIKAGAGLILTRHGEMIPLNDNNYANFCTSALQLTARNNFVHVMQALIDGGISARLSSSGQKAPLLCAVEADSHATAELLLEKGAESTVYNEGGYSLLMIAAKRGDEVMVRLLLKYLVFADACSKHEETALHLAAARGHYGIVKLLLHHGANSNLKTKKEKITPLHIAALTGHLGNASLLALYSNDVDTVDCDGNTALHHAVANEHPEVVRMLVSRGANSNKPNTKGTTPKTVAALKGNMQLIDALTPKDINPNAMIIDGDSLLSYFSRRGKLALVEKILDSSADVNDGGPNGVPPICCAAMKGHLEIVRTLLDRKANIEASEQKSGVTALRYAVGFGRVEIATLLLQRGADSNHANKRGTTPLWIAAQKGNLAMVQLLLEHGANPDTRSLQEIGALFGVAEKRSQEAVDRVQKYFDAAGTEEAYVSAVEVAEMMGHKDVVSLLKRKLRENKVAEPETKKPRPY